MNAERFLDLITGYPDFRPLVPHTLLLLIQHRNTHPGAETCPPAAFDDYYFQDLAQRVGLPELETLFSRKLHHYFLGADALPRHHDYFHQIDQGMRTLLGERVASVDEIVEALLRFLEDTEASLERSCPNELVELMAWMVSQHDCRSVFDPHCGTGRLLAGVVNQIDASAYGRGLGHTASDESLFHGLLRAELAERHLVFKTVSPLAPPYAGSPHDERFDAVISDLTMGTEDWSQGDGQGYHDFVFGVPPKSKGEWAYIQHMLRYRRDRSSVVIALVDQAALIRGGKEADIRAAIIEAHLLSAVVYLPAKLYRSDPRALAVLVFTSAETAAPVLMVNASSYFVAGKSLNTLTQSGLEVIQASYAQDNPQETDLAKLISIQALQEQGYLLNPERHFTSREEEEHHDLAALMDESGSLKAEIDDVSSKIDALMGHFR